MGDFWSSEVFAIGYREGLNPSSSFLYGLPRRGSRAGKWRIYRAFVGLGAQRTGHGADPSSRRESVRSAPAPLEGRSVGTNDRTRSVTTAGSGMLSMIRRSTS